MRRSVNAIIAAALAVPVLVGTAGPAAAASAAPTTKASTQASLISTTGIRFPLPAVLRRPVTPAVRIAPVPVTEASLFVNMPPNFPGAVPDPKVDYSKSPLYLTAELPNGCYSNPVARLVRTSKGTAYVQVTARRVVADNCSMMITEAHLKLTVPSGTRKVVDTTTGNAVRLMIAIP